MITSHQRGHLIKFEGSWKYADNSQPASEERPCIRCGSMLTSDGYDACLGFLPGVTSACCGHGVSEAIVQ